MRPLLGALAWVWGVAAAVLTALRWVDLAGVVPVLQAGLVPVGLSLVPLAALAWALGRRVLLGGAVVLGLVHLALALPWWWPETVEAREDDLVVAAANLEFGQASTEQLQEVVREEAVDALVLLEVTPAFEAELAGSPLAEELPHRSGTVRTDAGGTVVLSATPLGAAGEDARTGGLVSSFGFDQALLRLGDGGDATGGEGSVTLLGAHTLPPFPGGATGWRAELDRVGAVAGGLDGPLIVAGDLNASTGHPALRDLMSRASLLDAHQVAGRGWVRSWPAEGRLPAFVQIDHVLVRDLDVVDAGARDLDGSDHALVWARLARP